MGDTTGGGNLVTCLGQDGLKALRIGESQPFQFLILLHGQQDCDRLPMGHALVRGEAVEQPIAASAAQIGLATAAVWPARRMR